MIADLIQQSKRFGHKAGEMYVMMIHDSEQIDNMGETLHKSLEAYKENLEFILGMCEQTSKIHHGLKDLNAKIGFDSSWDMLGMNSIDQCVAWLRGEIKELENL